LPAVTAAAGAPVSRLTALAGSLVAAGAAWASRRRGQSPVPVVVAAGVTVASVWLLSQASPGPVTILLGALLGFSIGAPLAGQMLAGAPTAAALSGTAVLAVTAAFEPKSLYWSAAALGVTTSVGPLAARLAGATVPAARRVARRRVSWALTSVIVLTTGLTASWVGATSAS